MDSLEQILNAPTDYTVTGVDLSSPAIASQTMLNRRVPTYRVNHLLSFGTPATRTYLLGLINQARNDFSNPRPTLQDLANKDNIISGLNSNISTLNDRITELENEVLTPPDVTALKEEIDLLKRRIQSLESEVDDVRSAHTTDITALNSKISSLEGENLDLQYHASDLESENGTLITRIEELETSQTTDKARIATLSSRVNELESANPGDSISQANTQQLTHPQDMTAMMYLAAAAAFLSDRDVLRRRDAIFTEADFDRLSMNLYFGIVAAAIEDGYVPHAHDPRGAAIRPHRNATYGSDGTRLDVASIAQIEPAKVMVVCIKLHSEQEKADIKAFLHRECQFGDSCFIKRFQAQQISSGPRVITEYHLTYTEFVVQTLRPRRYPVSYNQFLRMIRSTTALRSITDAVSRINSE